MMRRFTLAAGRIDGEGCQFGDGTLIVRTGGEWATYMAWLNLATFRDEHPDSEITWIDTEETEDA